MIGADFAHAFGWGVMILSQWKAVWDMAASAFLREPIQWQMAIGLGMAFLTLMVLEGLRANFFPARGMTETATVMKPDATPPVTASPATEPPPQTMALWSPSSPIAPRAAALPRVIAPVNRKRQTARPRAHQPMRPRIQAVRHKHGEQSNP